MRGAIPAATFGPSLPVWTSAINRATRSRTATALSTVGRGSELGTTRPFLLPPIRPSSEALLGLAWKKQSPPGVAKARQGLPFFVVPLQRESHFWGDMF